MLDRQIEFMAPYGAKNRSIKISPQTKDVKGMWYVLVENIVQGVMIKIKGEWVCLPW